MLSACWSTAQKHGFFVVIRDFKRDSQLFVRTYYTLRWWTNCRNTSSQFFTSSFKRILDHRFANKWLRAHWKFTRGQRGKCFLFLAFTMLNWFSVLYHAPQVIVKCYTRTKKLLTQLTVFVYLEFIQRNDRKWLQQTFSQGTSKGNVK